MNEQNGHRYILSLDDMKGNVPPKPGTPTQWRIQDFPDEAANPKGEGAKHTDNFCPKLR